MKKIKFNPVSVFGKYPTFYILDGYIYIIIKNTILPEYNQYFKIIKTPKSLSYMIMIGKINKDKFKFHSNIPNLTLNQLYQLVKFLYGIKDKKLTYGHFGDFLVKRNIVKKTPKNINHVKPQGRYKTSDIATGHSPFVWNCGIR